MKKILLFITCFLIAYSTCQEIGENNDASGHFDGNSTPDAADAPDKSKSYPLNMTKSSFIGFVIGIVIGTLVLLSSLSFCFLRIRRKRRTVSPYISLTKDGKKYDSHMANEKGISMRPARDLLFPTQLSAAHNKTTYNSKDADTPTWDRKIHVERHCSIRLPKSAVKKWGGERGSQRDSKTKQWLESLEQQRDQRKQWLDGVEQQREVRKSWIVSISPRSADASILPNSPTTTREQRRSNLMSSLKQRETNPDAEKGEVKETSRNANRKSWNPELARRESGRSLTRSQRKSYRTSMIDGDRRLQEERSRNANEEDVERERAYVAQPAKKQSLFGEGGVMWETVLERV